MSRSRLDSIRRTGQCGLAATSSVLLLALAPAEAQQAPAELSLFDSPYVRIGSEKLEGPPETSFAGISGAVLLPSGEVVVADGGNHVVRWFDGSGAHVRSVGREGEGPGEFRHIYWIGACPGAEILVLDPVAGRATFMAAGDGDVVRTVILAPGLGFTPPLSCEGDGQLLVLMDRLGRRIEPGMLGSVTRSPAAVVRVDLSAGAQDTLEVLPGSDKYYASTVPGYSYLPLGGSALAAVGAGRLYAGQSDEDVIRMIDLRSGARAEFEHGLPRARVTRDAWNDAVSEMVWRQPLERTRRLLMRVLEEAPPVPERLPAFLAMRADAAGRLWLRLPGSGESTMWRILDAGGRHVASIALPSNVEPIDIGERRLVGLERGPLDVPLIRVYELPGPLQPDAGS